MSQWAQAGEAGEKWACGLVCTCKHPWCHPPVATAHRDLSATPVMAHGQEKLAGVNRSPHLCVCGPGTPERAPPSRRRRPALLPHVPQAHGAVHVTSGDGVAILDLQGRGGEGEGGGVLPSLTCSGAGEVIGLRPHSYC